MSSSSPRRLRTLAGGALATILTLGIVCLPAAPASAAGPAAAVITRGQSIGFQAGASALVATSTTNQTLKLAVQSDGNMVLYIGGVARYQTATRGANALLALQNDGNMVLYSGQKVLKSWNLHDAAKLALQPDGNLVVYSTTGRALWASRTQASSVSPAATTVPLATQIANNLLSMLNGERAANGLPALRMNAQLIASAAAHNLVMAQFDTMSHQLPGELDFAARILRAGFNFLFAGENIGWNSDRTLAGAQYLESTMYNEVAPNNGHRLNILSPNYTDVGIQILMDNTNQKMWLTEDFGKPQ